MGYNLRFHKYENYNIESFFYLDYTLGYKRYGIRLNGYSPFILNRIKVGESFKRIEIY